MTFSFGGCGVNWRSSHDGLEFALVQLLHLSDGIHVLHLARSRSKPEAVQSLSLVHSHRRSNVKVLYLKMRKIRSQGNYKRVDSVEPILIRSLGPRHARPSLHGLVGYRPSSPRASP